MFSFSQTCHSSNCGTQNMGRFRSLRSVRGTSASIRGSVPRIRQLCRAFHTLSIRLLHHGLLLVCLYYYLASFLIISAAETFSLLMSVSVSDLSTPGILPFFVCFSACDVLRLELRSSERLLALSTGRVYGTCCVSN